MEQEAGADARTSKVPVTEAQFIQGVTVVDIGDLRVARGMTRRPLSGCRHVRLVYDMTERRVWCSDCESEVEPFDAFKLLVERSDYIEKRIATLREAETETAHSRAGQAFDKIYRGRKMAPLCPHCRTAILPEDALSRLSTVSREWELRRRSVAKGKT